MNNLVVINQDDFSLESISNTLSDTSYLDCVAETYKIAKDACDAADLAGGQCTASMLIAAAATCLL